MELWLKPDFDFKNRSEDTASPRANEVAAGQRVQKEHFHPQDNESKRLDLPMLIASMLMHWNQFL